MAEIKTASCLGSQFDGGSCSVSAPSPLCVCFGVYNMQQAPDARRHSSCALFCVAGNFPCLPGLIFPHARAPIRGRHLPFSVAGCPQFCFCFQLVPPQPVPGASSIKQAIRGE
ncbi:unnamed protein product [Prorocentrum cordatum]|uniref:Uncharacterized protein n=1 Tax=Prorocentrum cordatum TaxID=2364126 RepID=A0ABN9UZF5_9DINO|nr:unnamed protein product [Polarella glacialis]